MYLGEQLKMAVRYILLSLHTYSISLTHLSAMYNFYEGVDYVSTH